jgi:MFS family permease
MPRLMLAFFASGFAALLCQVVWQRMLGVFAGSDTVSAALVVGAFLLGLGLGSILGARVADRLSPARALLGFALCESGVAIFALLSKPFLYDFLAIGLAGVVDAPAVVFALCFAGLVLPTTLMGASLPLLSRAVATSIDTVAQRIGWLYGLNTLGAGLGALLGGWVVVALLLNVGPSVLLKCGSPAVPQPTVSLDDPGDLEWIGKPKWICLSSFAGSMSSASGRWQAWRRNSGCTAGWCDRRWPVRCRRRGTIRSEPSQNWTRSGRSSTEFWRRISGRHASSGIRRGDCIVGC